MSDDRTLPRLLARNAARWARRPAWRHKRLGIWQTQTWSMFAQRVDAIAWGLAGLGFSRGERLAVLGDNRPELYAALLAAEQLGGVGVPLDPDAAPALLAAILDDAKVSVAIGDTVDQAEQLQTLAAGRASPWPVFCVDPGDFHRHETWQRSSLAALAATGQETARLQPGLLAAAMAGTATQDLALILYPTDAETASHPLALSHAQLVTAAEAIAAADSVRPTDDTLSYLPMASYEDVLYSLALGLVGGFACNCPEAPDSVLRDLREIGPTILYVPAAACTALAQVVTTKAAAATGLKRRCFAFFQDLAIRAETARERGASPGQGIGRRIGEWVAYAPVRDQLGLRRARWVHAGTSVPSDSARLLRAMGVALRPATSRTLDPDLAGESIETQHA